jgi:ribosomal protein S18 acetylase RimI-like enzyme
MPELRASHDLLTTLPLLPDRASLALRPEQPDDEAFQFELYASTRKEELDAWGWPEDFRATFLRVQFKAHQGYRTQFARADFEIIWQNGQRIGRWVVDRAANEVRLVDIALLGEHRNTGIGSALIRRLQAEAAAAGKPVRLTVLKGYRAARLYERLGFVRISESDLHAEMEWRTAPASGQ